MEWRPEIRNTAVGSSQKMSVLRCRLSEVPGSDLVRRDMPARAFVVFHLLGTEYPPRICIIYEDGAVIVGTVDGQRPF